MGTSAGDVTQLPEETPVTDAPASGVRLRSEILAGLVIVAASALLGLVVGPLWSAVSPHAVIVVGTDGLSLRPHGGDEFFACEGVFTVVTFVVGLISGVTAWYAGRRWRGPVVVAALVVGGLAGAVVAWQIGRHIGLEHYRALVHRSEVGTHFRRPVDVDAHGLLVAQPFASALAYVLLAWWTPPPDRPDAPQPDAPAGEGSLDSTRAHQD